ncbi:CG12986 [Drosophila busckii]|uniref:CG12986 n=1 Tax=Drosophila busckii TaxID=30019 RepID=A0A0M5J1G0_DROBS|nr:uncharacterized protein LOC108605389 [Drosophila busckii]ALC49861.1 CG12986 [Drosophila busckii]
MYNTLRIICIIALLGEAASALGASKQSQSLPFPLQLKIWQCRQRCYHKTLQQLEDVAVSGLCRSRPDCYMCHDYCRVLAIAEWSLAASMCADRIFCSQGCRTACNYHQLHTALDPFAAALANNALNKA